MSMVAAEPDSKTDHLRSDFTPDEISHCVCPCQWEERPMLALCGKDVSDEPEGITPTICLVCLDIIKRQEPCRICGGLD